VRVNIREQDVPLTKAFRARVEQRLGLALGRFAGRLGSVTVHLSSDGADKRCDIDVALHPHRLRASDINADLFAAIDHASGRLSSAVARALERAAEWEEKVRWESALGGTGRRTLGRARTRPPGGSKN
jgi:ribosomal subunit interface protein